LQQPAPDQRDLGVLLSDRPAVAAARFTSNRVVAAPVIQARAVLAHGRSIRGAIFNAGNANACTGPQGLRDANEMAALAAQRFGVRPDELVVASTGVIGVPLDMEKVRAGISRLELSPAGGAAVARAIMTTDSRPKQTAVVVDTAAGPVTVGGMAKGSGMIHPDLATMLAFITTDAPLTRQAANRLLGSAVDVSFNMITVDGDTSTNDMVLFLANGAAGGGTALDGGDLAPIAQALERVCIDLARAIAADGEGATRLIEVRVEGARNLEEARRAARAVAGSSLVRTAVYGEDANWGRILAVLGRCGVDLDAEKIDLDVGSIAVARGGCAVAYDAAAAAASLRPPEVRLTARLHCGAGSATAWGCDLTEEYVVINSRYTT
jgi:glutamate N-acetyltransferase/amino-acid N-acetyltransferase